MAVQPPNKTLPQDKDIVVSESKVTGDSEPREQLSQVLTNYDQAIQKEISDRIADVDAEEERALLAEAYLAKLIEEERAARLAASGGTETQDAINAESQARQASIQKLINAIQSDREPLLVVPSWESSKGVYIAKAYSNRIHPDTGDVLGRIVIPNGSDISNFEGGHINLSTGFNAVGENFTPINFAGYENLYSRYLFILLPNDTIEVRASSIFGNTPDEASYPSLATNGILVGSIVVRDDGRGGVGTIADIDPLTISYFKDSMGTASASAPVINTSPLEIQEDELFLYYSKEDFQEDKGALVGSTNGTNEIPNNGYIILDSGKYLTTIDLLGAQAREDAYHINAVQAKILYRQPFVDASPSVQFSLNGGLTWMTGTTYLPTSNGNLVVSDAVFPIATSALYEAINSSGSSTLGTHIGVIVRPEYNINFTSFSFNVKTSSTAGTVTAKIYAVSSGTPQTVIASASEVYACGSDITSTAQEKRFSFKPITLNRDQQYALVMEGDGLNSVLEVNQTSDSMAFNISSVSKNGGGWLPSGNKLCFKVYASGYELVMKVTSSANGSKIAGFGLNYVTDTSFMLKGHASWEDRVVSSSEASSNKITLNQITYTPGVRQLRLNIDGKEYFAPQDFSEVGPNTVEFPSGFLIAGQKLRFYNTYGLVDASSEAMAKLVQPADSYVRYVSITGSDSNTGSVNSPFRTIKAAQANAIATGAYYISIGPGYFVEDHDFAPVGGMRYKGSGINSTTVAQYSDASKATIRAVTFSVPAVNPGLMAFYDLGMSIVATRDQSIQPSGNAIIQMFTCTGSFTYNGYNPTMDLVQLRGAGFHQTISVRGCHFQTRDGTSIVSLTADTVGGVEDVSNYATKIFLAPGSYISFAVNITGKVRLSAFSSKIDGSFNFDAQGTNPEIFMDAAALASTTVPNFINGARPIYVDIAKNIGYTPANPSLWPSDTNTVKDALDHLITKQGGSGGVIFSYQAGIMVEDAEELQMGPYMAPESGVITDLILVAQEHTGGQSIIEIVNHTQSSTLQISLDPQGKFVTQSYSGLSFAYSQGDVLYVRVLVTNFLKNLTIQF